MRSTRPRYRPDVIRVNSRHLSRGGRPRLPVGGEFHFSRYPAASGEELLKMRAGGITVASTYVFWIMPEEPRLRQHIDRGCPPPAATRRGR